MATTLDPKALAGLDFQTAAKKHRGHVRRALVEGIVAVAMGLAAVLLFWGSSFASNMVHDQLADQKISFPVKGTPGIDPVKFPTLQKYASASADKLNYVDSGAEAKAYANDFIGKHIADGAAIVDGQEYTYATMGDKLNALKATAADLKAKSDPGYQAAADKVTAVNGQRESLFKGETLRGLLLYAWGWSLVGQIAGIVSIVAFFGAVVLLVLTLWGFVQARRDHAAMVALS